MYTLYGNEMSYFSGKARAYLRWKGVAFEEILPSMDIFRDTILPAIGWPVIPVMKMPDGQMVQDTADIIAAVEDGEGGLSVMPGTPVQDFVSYLIQTYADEWLTLPAMHYRWNHNLEWAYGEFGRNALPGGTPEQQYEAGKQTGSRFRGFVPALGVSEATIPGIEKSYEAFLADFSTHLEAHAYALGDRASFADFALIGPLYAHQYRDPYSGALMKRIAPRVADWVERVISGEGKTGELASNDAIPETLLPILRRQMAEQLPVLIKTNTLLEAWAKANPDTPLPRGFDAVPFEVEGHKGHCAARTFPLFRLQDALDALDNMDASDKARAAELLAHVGGQALTKMTLARRLARKNYRLDLERDQT